MQRLLCKEGNVHYSCIHLGHLLPFTILSHLLTRSISRFSTTSLDQANRNIQVATAILITTIFQNVAGKVSRPILSPKFCVKHRVLLRRILQHELRIISQAMDGQWMGKQH